MAVYIYIGYKKVCALHLFVKKPLKCTYNIVNLETYRFSLSEFVE